MTKEEAIEYCYKNKSEYVKDLIDSGLNGYREFECLITCLESGHIKPEELASYGMDY